MQNYLILKNISKSYNSLQALSNFNLTCNKGEIIVLLGENGSGKSTLISILSGSVKASSGDIFINNKKVVIDTLQKSFKEKIGVVFQHSSLIQEFSIIENLLLNLPWYKKNDSKYILEHYKKLCDFLEIDINPHSLIKNLSLSEQQLIELVRALWFNQEILLFDELTAHLTKEEVQKLENTMRILADKGCIILFITHKLDEAIKFADKIIVLQKGIKTLEITKEEIANFPQEQIEEKLYNAMFSQDNANTYNPQICNDFLDNEKSFFRLENVSTLEEKEERNYLKNISFEIHKGEILGIAGFEGQGQKILAETLAGQRNISKGAIMLDEDNISNYNLQKRQELGIFYVSNERLDVEIAKEENIAINLQLKNLKNKNFFKFTYILWKNIKDYALLSIKELAISSKKPKTLIHKLSGGNIQKIIIKRALTQDNTKLVILHEPSYGIDLKTKKEIYKQIIEEAQKGCAFILLSNDIEELLFLSKRISIINQANLTGFFPNDAQAYEKLSYAFSNKKQII